ncbi:MAG: discoidin domain-containing protein, partial [Kiritimatiellae bacterium]|nr:discoidin domain-containing protein [Kiritimatiellia bacterium]
MRIGLSGFLVGVAMAGVAGTPVTGRFVRVAIPKEQATLSLAEVQIFSGGQNVALKGIANQSETAHGGEARRAIDGNATPTWGAGSMTHTPENHPDPWWEVDLRKDYPIERIVLWNRVEIPDRLNDCSVMVIDKDRKVQWEKTLPKPNPKDTVLTVDAADHSGKVGQIVKGYVPPASDQEIVAAYEKTGNWVESVLAVQDKLESFRSLKALAPLLLRDFPAASEEIREEFIGKPFYHTKDVNQRLRALAVRDVAALPEEDRAAFRAQADAARQVAELDPIRAAFRRHC